MLGGLGMCGRPLCCTTFLGDFQPVSIKMAKEQSLSLNPTKISGVCGRLMCCLKYEEDTYEAVRKKMPRLGKDVITPDGRGTVTDLNILRETVRVRIPKGDETEIREYPLSDIKRIGQAEGNGDSTRKDPRAGTNAEEHNEIVRSLEEEDGLTEDEANLEADELLEGENEETGGED